MNNTATGIHILMYYALNVRTQQRGYDDAGYSFDVLYAAVCESFGVLNYSRPTVHPKNFLPILPGLNLFMTDLSSGSFNLKLEIHSLQCNV